MNDDGKGISAERLAALLDGTLDDEVEKKALMEIVASDSQLQAEWDLQCRIDQSLCKEMAFQPPTMDEVHQTLNSGEAEALKNQPSPRLPTEARNSGRRNAILAIAAAVATLLTAWQFLPPTHSEVAFEPVSLATIYRQSVDHGFEPYYECHDHDRFAKTFRRRQGKSLYLLEMPDDRYMTGLSYSGGLSRDTTAMLCLVDDKPVMVFVDRLENDNPAITDSSHESLTIVRSQRDGLVIYEVTPVPEKPVAEFLSVTKLGQLDF